MHIGIALRFRVAQHREADGGHGDGEGDEQMLSVDELRQCRADQRTSEACEGEGDGAGPLHAPAAPVSDQVEQGVGGNCCAGGADGDVRISHADSVEQQGRRQDGAAATEQRQQQADQRAARKRRRNRHAAERDHCAAFLFRGASVVISLFLTVSGSKPTRWADAILMGHIYRILLH